jgi:putative colanic acid biosynthesis acetyltransferase WcaF
MILETTIPDSAAASPDAIGGTCAFTQPCFSLKNRAMRAAWNMVYAVLFRPSPRPFHAWRAGLLRLFGARLGTDCHIYPKAVIWAPWNLICHDHAGIADGAHVYNPSLVSLGAYSVVSQEAYLCGASHDMDDPNFPLVSAPIVIGSYGWVCSRATVQMGVNVGEGGVLALGAVATRDISPWTVCAGVPARPIRTRDRSRFLIRGVIQGTDEGSRL